MDGTQPGRRNSRLTLKNLLEIKYVSLSRLTPLYCFVERGEPSVGPRPFRRTTLSQTPANPKSITGDFEFKLRRSRR